VREMQEKKCNAHARNAEKCKRDTIRYDYLLCVRLRSTIIAKKTVVDGELTVTGARKE